MNKVMIESFGDSSWFIGYERGDKLQEMDKLESFVEHSREVYMKGGDGDLVREMIIRSAEHPHIAIRIYNKSNVLYYNRWDAGSQSSWKYYKNLRKWERIE